MNSVNHQNRNLLRELPTPAYGEVFSELLRHHNLLIERIVSSDRPDPVLYDQDQDEWVILLEGRATMDISGEVLSLVPGDHIFIPAHTPHRVLSTTPTPRCVWLAVHLFPDRITSSEL